MTIKRTVNGVEMEFELTSGEVMAAYLEQESRNDQAEVDYLIEEYSDYDDAPLAVIEWTDEQIVDCAKATRKYLENHAWLNESINEARQDAFREWCEKNLGVKV